MRRVLWLLILGAAAVALAWWLSGLSGQVAATVAGYTIQTSTPVAAVFLAVMMAVLYVVARLLVTLVRLPWHWRRWRARRHRVLGDRAVTRTLVALAAGAQGDARREAGRARTYLGDTPQTLLLAAESERLAGSDAAAEAIYRRLAEHGEAGFLGLRGLFRQAMAREDWSGAIALVQRAEALHPGNDWLRDERTHLAVRTGNWTRALALSGPEAPRVAFTTAAAESAVDLSQAMKLARQALKDDPGFAPAALAYARRLRDAGRENAAVEVIRAAWKTAPNPELADFALASTRDPAARLKIAQRVALTTPGHPESNLLLARTTLAAGELKDARWHAEQAKSSGMDQKRLWLTVADIEAAEHGDTEAGRLAQSNALRRAAAAEPDPGWRCDACGSEQASWLPVCPACKTAGRMRWGGATRLALPSP